jgi:hypothetical protein
MRQVRTIRYGGRHRLLTALLLASVVVGCSEPSRVDPKASVTISGTIRSADGSPLADRPVKLGAGVSIGDGTLAYLTLGLACTSGICRGRVRDTETGSDGSYRFALKGKDTRSSFGEAESFLLTATAEPGEGQVSGASVSGRFTVQTTGVRLPVLDLVDPQLSVVGRSGQVAASWTTRAAGPYALTFETASVVPVWRTSAAGSTTVVDPRLLEDSAGRAVLSGGRSDKVVGSDLTVSWRSPGVGYASAVGAPPSRGTACGTGACALTDGDLGTLARPVCPTTQPCTTTTVDLGRQVSSDLVVVRGCAGGCAVEVSPDGRVFRGIGSVSDAFGAVSFGRAPVRYVRVGLGRDGLREVSVWGPARGDLKAVDQHATEAQFGAPSKDDHRTWWVALAAALVAVGLVGVGFVAGRRRSA